MSKNKGKGGKGKRKGKRNADDGKSRELEFKDEDQEYAQVNKMLGNGRLEATGADGTVRLCHIRGKFKKRVWINQGDIILLGLREYQDGKADVILKYTIEEAKMLQAYGEIPESMVINGEVKDEQTGGALVFGSDDSDQSDVEPNNAAAKSDDEKEKDWNEVLENL